MHLRDRAPKHEHQAKAKKDLAAEFCFHVICFPFWFWSSVTWFFTGVLQEIPCEVTQKVAGLFTTTNGPAFTELRLGKHE
jgi:hypothetical protein